MMAAPTLKRKKKKRRRSLVLKYWCLPPVLGCVAMIAWLATGPQWSRARILRPWGKPVAGYVADTRKLTQEYRNFRSEEHTSELQSLRHLVCRLLLEKKQE